MARPDLAALGLNPHRWQQACDFAAHCCADDQLPGAAFVAGRAHGATAPVFFGRQTLAADSPPLREDAIFLIASITKPVVAMAVLRLVEQGQLALSDRVTELVPEFGQQGKSAITVRHLLTHTSGLPDQLPNNRELRAARAPLHSFLEDTCTVATAFPPGRGVQYSSMGFVLLAEIVGRLSGTPLPAFLKREFFEPLGMTETSLGAPEDWFHGPQPTIGRIPEIRVPPPQQGGEHWNWNSPYWRKLGAPWGGLLTTPADLARYAQMILGGGQLEGRRVLSPATVDAASQNQLAWLRDLSEQDRRCKPWGVGWRLNWPAHSDTFGDLVPADAVGHWGATGTLLWIDRARDRFALILSTEPTDGRGRLLIRLSNVLSAAFD